MGPSYRPAPVLSELGAEFFDVVEPADFPQHVLRYRNQRWAARVGLDTLDAAAWERHFAGFEALPDNLTAPLAMRYHGHQFRIYNLPNSHPIVQVPAWCPPPCSRGACPRPPRGARRWRR